MKNIQSFTFWKKTSFILALILGAFFLKGVFLAALFPIFAGQDETKHFNSIVFLAEPRPISWPVNYSAKKEGDGMQKGNYTEDILETAKSVNFDEEIKGELYNTLQFIDGYEGKNEAEINKNKWKQYNENYPVSYAGESLYHHLASIIEKFFESQNILFRYFLARIFSVLLGTLTILASYLIVKNIGLSPKASLLLTAIIAFQPRFSIYYSAINYDSLLILMSTLFTLGGVLALKNGLNWKNFSLIATSMYLGILAKSTAYILLIAAFLLLTYFVYERIKNKNKKIKNTAFFLITIAIIILLIFIEKRFIGNLGSYSLVTLAESVSYYLSESLSAGRFALSSRTYWGSLGWVNNWFLDNFTNIIYLIESVSAIGIAIFFLPKKYLLTIFGLFNNLIWWIKNCFYKNINKEKAPNNKIDTLDFLPEKKYVIFLLTMLLLLQLGIRFADWTFFRQIGRIETGTPGRYFLPNIAAHVILVFTGIGALLRKEKWFEKSLIVGLILMMMFCMYIIFDVIIYRYYL